MEFLRALIQTMLYFKRLFSSNRSFIIAITLLFLASLFIRLTWMLYIQEPQEAIYSDMQGYITRAQTLLSGAQARDDYPAVLPYGTHYLYALEMFLFGPDNYTALAIVNAFFGAVCVVCVSLAAGYCFKSTLAISLVSILSCIWYPFISYNGFFSSEIPYGFFLYLSLILTFKYLNSGKYGLLTGLLYGIAFTIRPQMIMTFTLFVCWIIFRRKCFNKLEIRSLCALVLPVVIIAGYSMYRYHYFTGEIGLISGNGPVTKLFGATEYKWAEAYQTLDGKIVGKIGFGPPSSRDLGLTKSFRFEGRIIDGDIINKEIDSYQSKLSFWKKVSLKIRNVSLLAYRNKMWPERIHVRKSALRRFVFDSWPIIVKFYWFPLACIGFLSVLSLKNPYLEASALHLVTMFYCAYAYIGEIRYRVPYDLLLIIFAVKGVSVILSLNTLHPLTKLKNLNGTFPVIDKNNLQES